MHYGHVAAALYNQPHAIMPEKLAEIEAMLRARLKPASPADGSADSAGLSKELTAGPRPEYQVAGKTALIPVFGVLAQRMGLLAAISGGTSTERVGAQFDAALSDRQIRSIVLVVDSPGGSVFGVQELASKIHAGRSEKKVVAIADSLAASAAYWIASQATELVVTPGGQVGSVGVVAIHQDFSKAEEMKGVKTTLIHAGKYKTEGDPSSPLSAEGAEYVQAMVNQYYAMFIKAVARGRGVTEGRVEKDFGQGRMRTAQDAVSFAMADRVATLAQVLHRLGVDDASAAQAVTAARVADYTARAAEIASRG